MTEFYVQLKSISDVRCFVSAASLLPVDIDVVSGRYTVDAKSIMGLFSLELEKPILVRVYGGSEEGQRFSTEIGSLIVPEPEESL